MTIPKRTKTRNPKTLDGLLRSARKVVLPILAAVSMNGYGAPTVDYDLVSGDGNSGVFVTITNPDFTYDSATFDFYEVFRPVAENIQANNSAYLTSNVDDIMSSWDIKVSGSSEVYNGWDAVLSSGVLDLTHAPFGYTDWNETSDNALTDSLTFYVNMGNQLDSNSNGVTDYNEQLAELSTVITNGVTGYLSGGASISSDVNAIGVVPEQKLTPEQEWLQSYSLMDSNTDSDGDGVLNRDEYLADTDPTNSLSYFHFGIDSNSVSFDTSTNCSYAIEGTDSLTNGFVSVTNNISGTGSPFVFDPSSTSNRFFRGNVTRVIDYQ